MEIRLSDEQRLLVDVAGDVARDVADGWGPTPDAADRLPGQPGGEAWATLAGTGLLALGVPEAAGGTGGGCLEVALVCEQFGRFAVPAPLSGTALAVALLRACRADDLLASIAAGEVACCPALDRRLRGIAATLDGAVAWDCAGAASALAVVDGQVVRLPIGDPVDAVDLTRRHAAVLPRSAEAIGVHIDDETLDRVTAHALVTLSADLLGTMVGGLSHAVEHIAQRHQFGAPVGSFQAMQHLAAEAHVSIEATRSVVWYAAWAVDTLPTEQALLLARTAKAFASRAGLAVTEAAVQMLGGMGMTWESPAHVWLRRAFADRQLFGDEHVQFDRIAAVRLGRPAPCTRP